jgi:uncharacterized membrane protein
MKKELKSLLFLIIILSPFAVLAETVTFANPVLGTTGTVSSFFEGVIGGLLNIIAFLGVLFIVIAGTVYIFASSTGNDGMIETAKKILTGAIIGVGIGLAGPTFIDTINEIVFGTSSPTMPTSLGAAPTLSDIATQAISFLLSIIGILAIISLVINSVLYLLSGGDPSKTDKAKQNITWSIIGLIVALSSLLIVEQIINFIQTP